MLDTFWVHTVLVAAGGYLLGGFPTGVVLSRKKYGIDVREMGSGNIGATNVTRVFGWYAGVFVFLIDFVKGFLPIWFIYREFPQEHWLASVAAVALVAGHCFSPYLKGRGGKGVATSFGCLSILAPWGALIAAAVYFVCLLVFRISAVGSLWSVGSILIYLNWVKPEASVQGAIYGICFFVLIRHYPNIIRLLNQK